MTTVFTVQPSFHHRHSTNRASRSVTNTIVGERAVTPHLVVRRRWQCFIKLGFIECRWWNDGWTVKTVVTRRSSASIIPAPDPCLSMAACKRQKEKVVNYLAFDSSQPPGPCVKSKIITTEHEFFTTFLLVTLGLMVFYIRELHHIST